MRVEHLLDTIGIWKKNCRVKRFCKPWLRDVQSGKKQPRNRKVTITRFCWGARPEISSVVYIIAARNSTREIIDLVRIIRVIGLRGEGDLA